MSPKSVVAKDVLFDFGLSHKDNSSTEMDVYDPDAAFNFIRSMYDGSYFNLGYKRAYQKDFGFYVEDEAECIMAAFSADMHRLLIFIDFEKKKQKRGIEHIEGITEKKMKSILDDAQEFKEIISAVQESIVKADNGKYDIDEFMFMYQLGYLLGKLEKNHKKTDEH